MAENNFIQNATSDVAIDALMGVTDPAAIATDILLDQLIDALVSHYTQAASEIEEKGAKYFSKFKDADEKKLADLKAGKITEDDYKKWRAQKMLKSEHYEDLRNVLVSDMNNANQIAADIINNKKSDVYALNHNYGVYEVEHSTGLATSYVMYDHDTVENLIAENPQILPKNKINIPADKKWNMQKINNALTQGVLQGESIPDISKRLQSVTDMNKNAAVRNARTAVTGAQNAGREDSYKRAEKMGIKMTQVWVSTIDGRTRHSHRTMMGEKAKVGTKFSNGLRYPGDPEGPGWEVYNCRCTIIGQVDGVDYGIEDMVNNKLKEKDMAWDEWVNEQPLSKHYNESKAHYLQRYSEYKKNLSFSDWLEDQAAPDSAITSIWGDKKYGYVYNLIKNSTTPGHGADANNFFNALKDLGQKSGIGNPPQVWNAYMTGQLDAEDLNKFETILKKYLPDTSVSSVSDAITDAVNAAQVANKIDNLDNISDAAKQAESQLKFTKGTPMTRAEADTYKVNPDYKKGDYGTTHNCQTSTFVYECRRQGYDVTALPKYVDNNNNPIPGFETVGNRQKELAQNQSKGWINKETGQPPKMLYGGTVSAENIEKIIGTNGERYSMSVKWNKGGAHVVNVERDAVGNIWVIDNQRGPLEKNAWTLNEYLQKDIKQIGAIYRLDDCVPNPEFFNFIVKDNTSKIGISTGIKNTSENTIDVFGKKFTKQDLLKMDDDDLWETLSNIKSEEWLEKFDGPNFKKNVISELFDMEDIASEVESVFGKYSMSAVYKELQEQGVHNEFYNKILKPMGKQSDVWKKYVAGTLGPSDAAKIDDFLMKHLKTTNKTDDVLDAIKKALPDVMTDLDLDQFDEVKKIIKKYYNNPDAGQIGAHYYQWKKGLLEDDNLDKLFSKTKVDLPDAIKNVDFVSPATGELLDKAAEFEKIKKMPVTDLDDMAQKLTKDYYGMSIDDAKKILKESGLNIPEKIPATPPVTTAAKASKTLSDVNKLENGLDMGVISSKSASAVWKELNQAKAGGGKFWSDITDIANKYGEKPGELWKKYYLTGKLDPDDAAKIETHLAKIYSKSDDVSDIAKKWQHVDDVFDASIPNTILDDMAAKGIMDPQDHWKKYLAGEIKDADIDHALKGITPPVKTNKADNTLDAIKKTLPVKYEDLDNISQDLLDAVDDYFVNNNFTLKDSKVQWEKYVKGEISDPALDKILKNKVPKSPITTTDALDKFKDWNKKNYTAVPSNAYNKLSEIADDKNISMGDAWKKYLKGEIVDSDLDNYLGLNKIDELEEIKKTLPKIFGSLDADMANKTSTVILKNKGNDTINEYWGKYLKGEIKDSELDDILKATKAVTQATKPAKAATTVDMDLLKTKKVSKVWNELKDQGGNAYSQFWKTVGEAGKDYGLEKKQSKVWDMYLSGKLKPEEAKKIDDFLLKHYFNKADNAVDYSKFGGKEIYDILKNYDSYNEFLTAPNDAFNKVLNFYGNNKVPGDAVQKAIDEIKKLEKANTAANATAKATKAAEKSEELINAQEKLKKAQKELEEIKKEIDQIPNKTYTGIWKNDVTLADYESKQSTLAAKKQYYYEQIEELEHCIDDPDSWQFKKYGGKEGLNKKITEYEKYIDDLSEFEIKGKEYLDEKTKIDKKIKKAEKVVTDAQDEVKALTPVGEAFTQERKGAALWVKTKNSSSKEFKEADKYFESVAKQVHGSKTAIEHEGYYHYTWGSGPFNQPLAGFEGSWSPSAFKGIGKVDIDKNGYGDRIRGLTSLCERSTYDRDIWLQSGQDQITLEAFLGIKPGALKNMTKEQLQQFVGVQNEIPQFISTSINKGGGSYNPGDMIFNIYCPAGSEMLYVRSDGHFGKAEHEMILQRGGTYKLTKLYWDKSSGKLIADLEVHPELGYDKFQQTK